MQPVSVMEVTIRVFGELVPILGRRHTVELEEGATVGALSNFIAQRAGLKRQGYLGKYRVAGGDLAVLVNGRSIQLLQGVGTTLQEGDEVVFLPPAAGG
jgi:molybdopterin synthase sulfur carrier subunit